MLATITTKFISFLCTACPLVHSYVGYHYYKVHIISLHSMSSCTFICWLPLLKSYYKVHIISFLHSMSSCTFICWLTLLQSSYNFLHIISSCTFICWLTLLQSSYHFFAQHVLLYIHMFANITTKFISFLCTACPLVHSYVGYHYYKAHIISLHSMSSCTFICWLTLLQIWWINAKVLQRSKFCHNVFIIFCL